ncbi:MAG: DUF1697 domain-containing protein [Marmoricola sp.]
MTRSVAFFRNLNLGQRRSHSPTRPELLEAFARAGATDASNFQVNGTIVFEAGSKDAQTLGDQAVRELTPVCGYDDAVIVRPADWVLALELDTGPRAEVSFFDGPEPFPEHLPWEPPGAGLTVIRADALHAVSLNDAERTSGATWALERRLGMPVTSRGVPTMQRLQVRLRSLAD